MKYLKLFLVPMIIICSLVYGGTIDPSIADSKYIEYGKKFNCVVRVGGTTTNSKDLTFYASGVIVDSNHILTAAHVVNNAKDCFVLINNQKYYLSKIIIHKDFDTDFGIADIAIGYSEKKFNLDFYPELYTEHTEQNKVCAIAGYGLTGTFLTGAIKSDNKCRAGSNIIDRIYKDMLICSPSRKSSGNFTELEFLIAIGDSGGGLFIDGKLAGINSCVMTSNRSPMSKYNEESGHTRISKFIPWINENKTKVD